MTQIDKNFQDVIARIRLAASNANRNIDTIQLLAVSKHCSSIKIMEAWQCGQHCFGENFVQEALSKQTELTHLAIDWHFIGPIQSNKTRLIAESFAWVHSVDRLKIAQRLDAARPAHLPPLNILIQVNVSGEASKGGVEPGAETELAGAIANLPRIRLRGLMTIAEPTNDHARLRQQFALLRQLHTALQTDHPEIDTLSMGMSADLELAIAEGATLIRVGTDLFGARKSVDK
jgi:pyridoxal phosphate enzyme (YggS family)